MGKTIGAEPSIEGRAGPVGAEEARGRAPDLGFQPAARGLRLR
jgi:hypothetical protein